jgi:hypothetical protein
MSNVLSQSKNNSEGSIRSSEEMIKSELARLEKDEIEDKIKKEIKSIVDESRIE